MSKREIVPRRITHDGLRIRARKLSEWKYKYLEQGVEVSKNDLKEMFHSIEALIAYIEYLTNKKTTDKKIMPMALRY